MEDSKPILDGIKVIDCGSFVAGPAAATIMSDFGADVIKLEPPGLGDTYRYLPRATPMPNCKLNYSWLHVGRNKKSLALDLKKAEAREPFEKLVKQSDVFLTNLPPEVQVRLNITYEDLAPLNDRLIHVSLSGYGEKGPEANMPGYDATSWWARSGLMEHSRAPGASRNVMPPAAGDYVTSMGVYSAIMTALFKRERTGKGSRVHTSLLSNGLWANSVALQAVLCGATIYDPATPEETPQNLVNHFECRDGRAFIVAIIQDNKNWSTFANCLERPDLATDVRFATAIDRQTNLTALSAILDEVFVQKDWQEWSDILLEHRITTSPINRIVDVADDQQVVANNMLVDLEIPDHGTVKMVDSPFSIDGATKVKPRVAPKVGEHTEEILMSLDCSDAEIQQLRDVGAIPK